MSKKQLYLGMPGGEWVETVNENFANESSKWFIGTELSSQSTEDIELDNPDNKYAIGSIYLNNVEGLLYQCISVTETNSIWKYKGVLNKNLLDQVTVNKNNISQLSNPNLLINGDFQIWTKGTSFTNTLYTADKWRFNNDDLAKTGKMENVNGRLRYTVTSDNSSLAIAQLVDDIIAPNTTYTISTKISSTNIDVSKLDICIAEWGKSPFAIGKTKIVDNIYSLTFTTPSDFIGQLYVAIGKASSLIFNIEDYLEIEWVKLELGSIATPFIPKPYVEELQDCLMYDNDKVTTPYSNPNLLINGDFKVWQRGESFNDILNNYTADRWKVSRISSITGANVQRFNGNSIKVIKTGGFGSISVEQPLENINVIKLRGKRITFSLDFYVNNPQEFSGATIFIRYSTLADQSGTSIGAQGNLKVVMYKVEDTNIHRIYLTCDVPNDANSLIPCFYCTFADGYTNSYYVTTNWKLELGSVATPFTPRNYEEELAVCRRYFQYYSFYALAITTTIAVPLHSLPIPMRITPTILKDSNNEITLCVNEASMRVPVVITLCPVVAGVGCERIFSIQKDSANTGSYKNNNFVAGTTYKSSIYLDAEIY